jgi:hypothetical protein
MATVGSTRDGCSRRIAGSNSIPTDTKNRTVKGSCKGWSSVAARSLWSEALTTMPAKKAPSANDTPNSSAEPRTTPIAAVTTASVNSSRDPVATTRSNSQRGRRPGRPPSWRSG